MAIVTNRGTSQIRTTSNYRRMNTKCNYTHVNNIKMTVTEFLFLYVSLGTNVGHCRTRTWVQTAVCFSCDKETATNFWFDIC